MNYSQAREYIEEISCYGSVLGLDTMQELMNRLGNPQDSLACIHVAGTNGKGSVIAYLAEIYKEAGYRIGRYVSPTLLKYRERIQVNGKFIEKESFAAIIERIKEVCDSMVEAGFSHPTTFEVETAAAYLYFQEKQCDIALIETGLGGKLDATNVIKNPICCVFTSISRDHMGFLGDSLTEIADEKAGILMGNTIAVSVKQKPEVMQVLETECGNKGIPFMVADYEDAVTKQVNAEGRSFSYKEYENLEITLPGACQIKNAVTAVETVLALNSQFPVREEAMRNGLRNTYWFGRMTKVSNYPLVYVDGAHNEDAALELVETIKECFRDKRIVAVVGMFADKEYEKVLAYTLPFMESVITITIPENSRSLPGMELAKVAMKYHNSVTYAGSLKEAFEMAQLLCGEDGMILAFGSLSYIGEFAKLAEQAAWAGKNKVKV